MAKTSSRRVANKKKKPKQMESEEGSSSASEGAPKKKVVEKVTGKCLHHECALTVAVLDLSGYKATMSASALVFPLVVVFCLTFALLSKYGNFRKQTIVVSISTFVGWYFSFLIILILPLDISITFYNKCLFDGERMKNETTVEGAAISNVSIKCEQPNGYVPGNVLLQMWRVVYWTSQMLTWIVLPLMQSYSRAGDFTVSGKLKSAAYNNIVYYTTYFTVFFILLIYAISKGLPLNFEHLKVILVSASNTWGLFLLTILLGYGLVEVPRQLWQMGNKGYRLNKTYFDLDKLSADKNDAEEAIKDSYRESREILTLLRNEHGYRDLAQIIVSEFPAEVVAQITSGRPSSSYASSSYSAGDIGSVGNEAFLIRFHKRVLESIQNHHRTQAQWNALMEKALFLEDVEQASVVGKLSASRGEPCLIPIPASVRYYWHVFLKRPVLQVCGILFASMTVLIMWSECTFFIVTPTLSLAARLLHSFALGYHYKYIQICAMILISYLCICAYYTVFKLRIYRYYHLDPHHQTDANSLLFSAILLCRLTPPICLNFLGMIHLDSHITSDLGFGTETQFTRLMGHLDVIPFVAKGINIYLPILIVILCLSTWFRLGTRFLHSLGIDQFVSDDEMTADMVQSGRAIVTLERNRMNREANREQREQYWADKLQQNTSSRSSGLRDVESQDHFDYTNQSFSDCTPIISAEFGKPRDPHHPPTDLFSDM